MGIPTHAATGNYITSPVPMTSQRSQPWMTKQYQIYEYDEALRAGQRHGSYPDRGSIYTTQGAMDNWTFLPGDTSFQKPSLVSPQTSVFYPDKQEYNRGNTLSKEHAQDYYRGYQSPRDYGAGHYSGYPAMSDYQHDHHHDHLLSRPLSKYHGQYHHARSTTTDQSRLAHGDQHAACGTARVALTISIVSIVLAVIAIVIAFVLRFTMD